MNPNDTAAAAVAHQCKMRTLGIHVSISAAVRVAEREAARATPCAQFLEPLGPIDPTSLERLVRAYRIAQQKLGEPPPTDDEAEAFVRKLWDWAADTSADDAPSAKPYTGTWEPADE